jgi:DNA-binding response OmpR family regulator
VSRSSNIVLVVEDDPDLRRLFGNVLMLAGFPAVTVEDGLEALRYLDGTAVPAAVVLDLELPRVSGFDVHREMLAHTSTSHVPIVVVTGNPAGFDTTKVKCVLIKPIDVDDLVRSVAECVRAAPDSSRERGPRRPRHTGIS